MRKNTPTQVPVTIEQTITQWHADALARENAAHEERLRAEAALKAVRGTRDVADEAREATARNAIGPLPDVAFSFPHYEPRTNGTETKTTPDVSGAYFLGPNADTLKIYSTVVAAISERPRTRAELVDMTGVEPNRINSALVKAQREGLPVKNLGTQVKAVWFIPAPKRRYSSRTER